MPGIMTNFRAVDMPTADGTYLNEQTVEPTPPASTFAVDVSATVGGTASEYSFAVTATDGTIVQVSYDFGDGNIFDADTAPFGATHTYAGPGTYTATAVATEADGVTTATDTVAVTVGAGGPVSASAEVPDGTIADVTAWVGDDPYRAQQAFDAEHARSKPRATLLEQLNEIMSGENKA